MRLPLLLHQLVNGDGNHLNRYLVGAECGWPPNTVLYGRSLLPTGGLPAKTAIAFQAAKPDIILPVGISFYTFVTLYYTLDVYRRKFPPEPSFLNFALFVTYFPHLVAGPIVRPKDLIPQV